MFCRSDFAKLSSENLGCIFSFKLIFCCLYVSSLKMYFFSSFQYFKYHDIFLKNKILISDISLLITDINLLFVKFRAVLKVTL